MVKKRSPKIYQVNCNLKMEEVKETLKRFAEKTGCEENVGGYETIENGFVCFLVWEKQKDEFLHFLDDNNMKYEVNETLSWWDTASPAELRHYNEISEWMKRDPEGYQKALEEYIELLGGFEDEKLPKKAPKKRQKCKP